MSVPLYEVTSHIQGKNAKVRVFPDRVEWEVGKSVSSGKMTAAVITLGMSAAVTGGVKSRKGAGTEVILMRSITSVTTKRDSLTNDVVSIITSGNTIDMRVSKKEAAQLKQLILDGVAGRLDAAPVAAAVASPPPAPPVSVPAPPSVPAGWLDDPSTPGQLRYWDGSAWTEHVHPKG